MNKIKLKTFQGETPETSDVVLCHYCGTSLHAPENDVFWDQLTKHPHKCVGMYEAAMEENSYSQAEWNAMKTIAYSAGYYQAECGLPFQEYNLTLNLKLCSMVLKAQQRAENKKET